jgi:hypothetical protein
MLYAPEALMMEPSIVTETWVYARNDVGYSSRDDSYDAAKPNHKNPPQSVYARRCYIVHSPAIVLETLRQTP